MELREGTPLYINESLIAYYISNRYNSIIMDKSSVIKDLGHKVKSVADLIRFVSNTAPSRDGEHSVAYPNFSLFLGAGASVSSGIRSGGQLINDWKEEIKKEKGIESIDDYLKSCSWYDATNEYASLFENRFDLQRQRRIFVEKEVSEKTPSIGYAYLISLVNNGWFNTIFTTNFDDLINESFYRFSKRRPVVCAHDSSISAVTITSDRPKIIKLHGDYLFDNIKATLRETESLEANMQMKLREFAKNGGLIIVGYSGQDRSVMDILSVLVSQPDYFKNGVYWCIREKDLDSIGSELVKFLWRDRVYLVPIEGFDELMAEMSDALNDGALPIKNELLSREHHDEIVRGLTTNPYVANSKSEILKKACKELSDSVEKNLVDDYLRFVNHTRAKSKQNTSPDNEPQFRTGLTPMTEKEKSQIQEWSSEVYIAGHRQKVLNDLSSLDIFTLPVSQYKLEVLGLFMEISADLSDEKIKLFHDELIRLNPKKQSIYLAAAARSERFSQKVEYLKRAIDACPNDYFVYNKYVECLVDYKTGYNFDNEVKDTDADIDNAIEKSIGLNRRLSNGIWVEKARWIAYKYRYEKEERKSRSEIMIKDLLDSRYHHPNMLEVLNISKSDLLDEAYFQEYLDFYVDADNVDYLEQCYILYIEWLQCNKSYVEVKNKIEEYETIINPSNRFVRNKALWFKKYMLYDEALQLLEGLRLTNDDKRLKIMLLGRMDKREDLEKFFNAIKRPSDSMKVVYYESMELFDRIVGIYEKKISNNEYLTMADVSTYSYSLLQIEKYTECYNFLSSYYSNPETCEAFIIVNYLMAKKYKPGKTSIESEVKKKLIERPFMDYGEDVMAAGYSLLSDKKNMMKSIKKELNKNPDFLYCCKVWPVLKKSLSESDYKALNEYIKSMNIVA